MKTHEDPRLEIARERNGVYEAAIAEIRKTAEDQNLSKSQKVEIIRGALRRLDERMWALKVKEAQSDGLW